MYADDCAAAVGSAAENVCLGCRLAGEGERASREGRVKVKEDEEEGSSEEGIRPTYWAAGEKYGRMEDSC